MSWIRIEEILQSSIKYGKIFIWGCDNIEIAICDADIMFINKVKKDILTMQTLDNEFIMIFSCLFSLFVV